MIDKNGKLFGKVSVIDVFVLVIIFAVGLGTAYRFSAGNRLENQSSTKLAYTIKINGVRSFTYQYYKEGLQCFDQKTGQNIGVIKSVRQEPYTEEYMIDDGTMVVSGKPDIIVVYVEIEASGTQTQTAYFANGTYEVKVGSEVHLNTKYIDVTGTVYDINLN